MVISTFRIPSAQPFTTHRRQFILAIKRTIFENETKADFEGKFLVHVKSSTVRMLHAKKLIKEIRPDLTKFHEKVKPLHRDNRYLSLSIPRLGRTSHHLSLALFTKFSLALASVYGRMRARMARARRTRARAHEDAPQECTRVRYEFGQAACCADCGGAGRWGATRRSSSRGSRRWCRQTSRSTPQTIARP
jgi:hypothetical protein